MHLLTIQPHVEAKVRVVIVRGTRANILSLTSIKAWPIMYFMIGGQRHFSDNHTNELGLFQMPKASPLQVSLIGVCVCVCSLRESERNIALVINR